MDPRSIFLQCTDKSDFYCIPLWWADKEYDLSSYKVDDQFLVGNDILVIPILEKGSTMKDAPNQPYICILSVHNIHICITTYESHNKAFFHS